jgi:ABC-type nitrate/sulfonate/bicarbonate transport system substrate-binding protein
MLQSTALSGTVPADAPAGAAGGGMVQMRAVELGSFTPSVVLEVARRTGALTDAGLDVAERPVPSSPSQFRSLIDGDLHVGLTNPDNVLAYRFDPDNPLGELVDARILAGIDRGLGLGVWARPGAVLDDLRGAAIGVDVPGSGFALALFTLLERRGLVRDDYEVVKLGSTPQRLQALLDGGCVATMLGAGNDLSAEAAGCTLIASVRDELAPYLATVVCVVRDEHLEVGHDLADVLTATAAGIVAGDLTGLAVEAATARLGLGDELAQRYVAGLADPVDGLVVDGAVDPAALRTVLDLRRHWLPRVVDGRDVLADALDDPGLVVRR